MHKGIRSKSVSLVILFLVLVASTLLMAGCGGDTSTSPTPTLTSPSGSYTDNGNGTVTDNRTGLLWQQGEPGIMTWFDAMTYCDNLALGGYTDWLLPNITELESIIDNSKYNPAIDTTYFPNAYANYYWSSTTAYFYNTFNAGSVYFLDGYVYYLSLSRPYKYYVRCTRGGQ